MRIVLATWGSFGDLHPFLAIALGLRERGHTPVIASCPIYREKVESEGIAFAPLRPDLPAPGQDSALLHRVMDRRHGPRMVIRDLLLPALRETDTDFRAACIGADLAVAHPLIFSAAMLAESGGVPYLCAALQPMLLVSAHDPPIPPDFPVALEGLMRAIPPAWMARFIAQGKRHVRPWFAPVDKLRREYDLPTDSHPMFEGAFPARGTLALFSSALAAPQPDWPAPIVQTGFPFYDRLDAGDTLSPEIEAFLDAGEAPLLFTLGTSAVVTPGSFFTAAAHAAAQLGRRAILLIGRDPAARDALGALPDGVAAFAYAPYSELMPRCAAVVHQGGVGTVGQALRAGKPQLVVPFAHDQPDHASRLVRAGVAGRLDRDQMGAARLARALHDLLNNPRIARRAAELGEQVRSEDGVGGACDAIETGVGC